MAVVGYRAGGWERHCWECDGSGDVGPCGNVVDDFGIMPCKWTSNQYILERAIPVNCVANHSPLKRTLNGNGNGKPMEKISDVCKTL